MPSRRPARSGLAFQLTNFLRDVGEDLDRGRVYLPQEDLRRFGADPHARVVTPEWRALMAFEIERNRRLYREADDGIPALPGASRRCVATARVLYARILERIEDADYDVFASRARVSTPAKAALAARMVVVARADAAGSRRPGRARPARRRLGVRRPRRAARRRRRPRRAGAQVGRAPRRHPAAPRVLLLRRRPRRAAARHDPRREQAELPGVVTNTVCGHPRPGEDLAEAVRRRARSELGVEVRDLRLVLPDFRYRAVMNGLVEHELCPVFVGFVDDDRARDRPRGGRRRAVGAVAAVPRRGARRAAAPSRPGAPSRCRCSTPSAPDPRAWPAGPRDGLPPAAELGPDAEAA